MPVIKVFYDFTEKSPFTYDYYTDVKNTPTNYVANSCGQTSLYSDVDKKNKIGTYINNNNIQNIISKNGKVDSKVVEQTTLVLDTIGSVNALVEYSSPTKDDVFPSNTLLTTTIASCSGTIAGKTGLISYNTSPSNGDTGFIFITLN